MISGAKLSKAAAKVVPAAFFLYKPNFLSQSSVSSPPIRLFSGNDGFNTNPVTLQMINYALSLARSEKSGNAALSYGEFLHAMRNFPMAKELYRKVIQGIFGNKDFTDLYNLSAGNMASEEVLLAATCSLGQLESHLGNFADAKVMLTQA